MLKKKKNLEMNKFLGGFKANGKTLQWQGHHGEPNSKFVITLIYTKYKTNIN